MTRFGRSRRLACYTVDRSQGERYSRRVPASEAEPWRQCWAATVAQIKHDGFLALFWELVRFGWVGLVTASLYAAQMWALSHFNDWPTSVNALVADGPCLTVNYLLHRSFSFRSKRRHVEAGPRYLIVQLTGLGINSGVLWYSVDHMRWPFLPTQLVAIAILALFSYTAQKLWSF